MVVTKVVASGKEVVVEDTGHSTTRPRSLFVLLPMDKGHVIASPSPNTCRHRNWLASSGDSRSVSRSSIRLRCYWHCLERDMPVRRE